MDKKVCILIVTYNRKEYLEKLLEALKKQTIQSNSILIFDNFSSDGTDSFLKNNGYVDKIKENELQKKFINNINYLYYRNHENSGGAGGFHKAFEIVQKLDCEYVWVMDDDVLPKDKCLEELLKFQTEDTMITIPNRTANGFIDNIIIKMNLNNPFKIFMKKKTVIKANQLEKNIKTVNIVDMPFEGPLINVKLIEKVGLPNEEYFLQFDDTDYATRSLKYTNIKFITEAILKKQIISKTDNNAKKTKLMNWKDYYAYRNDIIYCRKYGKNFMVKYITPILLWTNLFAKALVRRKYKNIKIINKAFYDGYFNRTGKTVEPGSI